MIEWSAEAMRGKSAADLIRIQLEDWMWNDTALMETYDPEMVDDCLEWVANDLRSHADHVAVMAIWHEDVFRKARDYFVDGRAKEEKERKKRAAEKAAKTAKKWEKKKEKTVGEIIVSDGTAKFPESKPAPSAQTDLFQEVK